MWVTRRIAARLVRRSTLAIGCVGLVSSAFATDSDLGDTIRNLAHESYAVRFDAALRLIGADAPELDARLAQAIDGGHFAESKAGSVAAEFVRLKRSGEDLSQGPPPDFRGVNVFLISVDTLRADHLSCYGYARPTSPAIDQLAARGALFESASSPSSWTLPAHMSLFTSLYPSFHKLEKAGVAENLRLDDSVQILPELLKAAGYTTAGFAAHGYMSAEWGFDRGFDLYRSYVTEAGEQSDRVLLWLEWHGFHVGRGLVPPRFFLFAHYLDPHGASKGKKKFLKSDIRPGDPHYRVALYDSQIHLVDANLKRIFQRLWDAGWGESTLVILVSDHGEEFGEHGATGHKSTLYQEQLRVPLLISYPHRVAAGQRVEVQASLVDILPTVLELVGTEPPPKLQGLSLVPYMKMKGQPSTRSKENPRPIFGELHPIDFSAGWDFFSKAIRVGDYKFIQSSFKDGRVTKELYDLSQDPKETLNLYEAKKDGEEIRELETSLRKFVLEGAAYKPEARSGEGFNIDDRTRDQLRALGYID